MAGIELETRIAAPIERVFDACRDLDLHQRSMEHTAEKAVAGKTSGLIECGEEVTWEAKHFGIRQRFTSRISRMDRPVYFRDEMVRGAFRTFVHDHFFAVDANETTIMRDVLEFVSPFWLLGKLVDNLIMAKYLRNLLDVRNRTIKRCAETGGGPRRS